MGRERSKGKSPVRESSGWLLPAALAAAAALFLLLFRDHGGALVDDAYISFRYAARWASGLGLTWNDGSRVEGFSNPLWTFLLGAGARLGIAPHQAAPWLGLGFLLGVVGMGWKTARALGFSSEARAVVVGGLALDVGLVLWSGSGLESAEAAFLVTAWLWVAVGVESGGGATKGVGRGILLGLLGVGLVLSRPEGVLWAGWGLAWLIWGAWARPGVLWGWVLGMTPAAGYELFRWRVYGRLLPNTFFAKVETGFAPWAHGGMDLLGWVGSHLALAVLALAPVLALATGRGPRRKPAGGSPRLWWVLPAGWVALQAVFVLLAGGDWMGQTRYMASVLPAVYLLTAASWNRMETVRRPLVARAGLGLLLTLHLGVGWLQRDRIPEYTRIGRELGLWLASVSSPQDTVAVTAAGAIPYFSGLPAYDILGINDPEVAGRTVHHAGSWAPGHHRYDLDRLLKLRPRWIVWDFGVPVNERRLRGLRGWRGDPDKLDYRRSLLARPGFRDAYQVDHGAPRGTQGAYTVFRRR